MNRTPDSIGRFFMRIEKTNFYIFGLIIITGAIYSLGLPGGFEFDDAINLTNNPGFKLYDKTWESILAATFSSGSGQFQRVASMFTFALNQYFFGLGDPISYKVVNIVIHLSAGYFFYVLSRILLPLLAHEMPEARVVSLSLLSAGMWMLHPLNLTSVLYVIQRMTSLAAVFSILGCIAYLRGRQCQIEGNLTRGIFFIVGLGGVCWLLGVLSKESAIILPGFWLLFEIWIFKFKGFGGRNSKALLGFYGFCFLVAASLIYYYCIYEGGIRIVELYRARDFSMSERLLTEIRVLWFYMLNIIFPQLPEMGLYHDDYVISSSLFEPVTTIFSIVAWILVVIFIGASVARRRARIVSFALAWYLIGHVLESSFWPLELVHEHRNYLPSVMVVLALAYALTLAMDRFGLSVRCRKSLCVIPLALLGGVTSVRAMQWGDATHEVIEAINHPKSARANYAAGAIYINRYISSGAGEHYREAIKFFERSIETDRMGVEIGFLGLIFSQFQVGVYPDNGLLDKYRERLKKSPVVDININHLQSLASYQWEGGTRLSDADYLSLLEALESNRRSEGGVVGNIHIIKGNYYANKVGDVVEAEKHFAEALRMSPSDIRQQLNWLNMLIGLNRQKEALAMIDGIERHPDVWKYRNQLSEAVLRLDGIRLIQGNKYNGR